MTRITRIGPVGRAIPAESALIAALKVGSFHKELSDQFLRIEFRLRSLRAAHFTGLYAA